MFRSVALLLMVLSVAQGADPDITAYPVGSTLTPDQLAQFLALPAAAVVQKTLDPVRPDTASQYPSFNDYYQTCSKSREGKMFEAEFANRYNAAKTGKVCIPTAVLGAPADSADDLLVDRASRIIEGHVQCKRTLTLSALEDPRYQGMQFATTAESSDNLLREVKAATMSAARRGVPLSEKLAMANQSFSKGIIMTTFPDGSAMPSIKVIAQRTRESTWRQFKAVAPTIPIDRPSPPVVSVLASPESALGAGDPAAQSKMLAEEVAEKAVIVDYLVLLGQYAKDVSATEADLRLGEDERQVKYIDAKLELMGKVPFSEEFKIALIDHPDVLIAAVKDPTTTAKAVAEEVYRLSVEAVQKQQELAQEHAIQAAAALRTAQQFYSEKAADAAYAYKDLYDRSMFAHAVTYWMTGDSQ